MPSPELVLVVPLVREIDPATLPVLDGRLHLENTTWVYLLRASQPDVSQIFVEASSHPLDESELQRIQNHHSLFFIKGSVNHPKDLLVLARFVNKLLAEHQTGVYVQNAGICHGADFWNHLASEDSLDAAVEMFLGLHLGDDYMLVQGMEVLGLPDVILTTKDPEAARELILTVCLDGIQNADVLRKNARILHGDDEQVYRLQEVVDSQNYLPEMSNPQGLLRLVKSF